MAGKATSLHFSVVDRTNHKTVLQKTFFNAKELKDYLKDPAFLEKYPENRFYTVKETY